MWDYRYTWHKTRNEHEVLCSLFVGGNSNGTFGFAGCIRDAVFNGVEFDVVDIVNNDDSNATVPGKNLLAVVINCC